MGTPSREPTLDDEAVDPLRPAPEPDTRRLISTNTLFDEYLARKTTIVPCALAGLSRLLGGGFETRKNVVVTTQAGGGKTGFLVQHAAYAVLNGEFFAVLALKDGDQWSDGLRLAQMAGVDRFALRDRVPQAVEAAREVMARHVDRLMFYDVTEPGACFAHMAEMALRWVDGRGQIVLGTDSIHVFPANDRAKERAMPIYDRIALRLETMHDFLVANDAAGLTVGQAGRPSYSKKRDEENVDLIAAVSGGHVAENTVDVLIVATKPNESGTRFLVVPKSRLGGQGARIPVRYDEERSMWFDTEPAAEEAGPRESRAQAKQGAKLEEERKAEEAVALVFRRSPEGLTAEEVRAAVNRARPWVNCVVDKFHAQGLIRLEPVHRKDARGRNITVQVWKWKTS
jgi:hypothetical protein